MTSTNRPQQIKLADNADMVQFCNIISTSRDSIIYFRLNVDETSSGFV